MTLCMRSKNNKIGHASVGREGVVVLPLAAAPVKRDLSQRHGY